MQYDAHQLRVLCLLRLQEHAARHGALTLDAAVDIMAAVALEVGLVHTGTHVLTAARDLTAETAVAIAADALRINAPLHSNFRTLAASVLEALAAHSYVYSEPPPTAARALSDEQLRVLQLVADGKTIPEIARGTGKKEGTVKSQLELVRRSLGASNNTHAVYIAARQGLLGKRLPVPAPRTAAA